MYRESLSVPYSRVKHSWGTIGCAETSVTNYGSVCLYIQYTANQLQCVCVYGTVQTNGSVFIARSLDCTLSRCGIGGIYKVGQSNATVVRRNDCTLYVMKYTWLFKGSTDSSVLNPSVVTTHISVRSIFIVPFHLCHLPGCSTVSGHTAFQYSLHFLFPPRLIVPVSIWAVQILKLCI
jgi:hypothetical protein